MNILITAPSLDTTKNVSGVATVTNTIVENNGEHCYFHYLLGRPDKPLNKVAWLVQLTKQLLFFPLFVRRNKIDLAHQNLPFNPKGLLREYIINFWCKLLKLPVVLHVHGGEFLMNRATSKLYQFIAQSLFKHSRQVIVLSELEKQALIEHYNYNGAIVLCNSINVIDYKGLDKQYQSDKPVLLFLGRIHESKGIEDIIEAFKMLIKYKKFKFVLCGSGPLADQVIALFTETLGVDFEYKGVVSGKQKIDVIKSADFFLLPSRYGEGLPMALLETMAAGVVPVVTDDASMKYVVRPNENGIRVNKRDPQDLCEKLNKIMSDSNLYNLLSNNAKKTIIENYDIENYIVSLNKIYNNVKL